MKKVLVLLPMAFVAQGSLLLGHYENLNKYLKNSNITQRCLENYQSRFLNTSVVITCGCLENDLSFVKRGLEWGFETGKTINKDTLSGVANDLSKLLKDRHDIHKVAIAEILNVKDEDLQKEYNAYQDALDNASNQALADALERIKK